MSHLPLTLYFCEHDCTLLEGFTGLRVGEITHCELCFSVRERKFLIWNNEVKMNIFFYFPASPLKKGEKNAIWNWPLYKLQLPVTCGLQEGILDRNRLAKGQG